jgi:hypothetical protein
LVIDEFLEVSSCSETKETISKAWSWLQGIAAISMFKIPNPYVELDARLDQFVKIFLLVPLCKLNAISGLRKLCKKVHAV